MVDGDEPRAQSLLCQQTAGAACPVTTSMRRPHVSSGVARLWLILLTAVMQSCCVHELSHLVPDVGHSQDLARLKNEAEEAQAAQQAAQAMQGQQAGEALEAQQLWAQALAEVQAEASEMQQAILVSTCDAFSHMHS